ncbi:MAG: PEP-CTERM sorting domain-containing protein [Candidatus Omnitrophica bacterium]|nr:PEP-CTERM sorting domain-containing protein [Candidatus Omnitrophota bacterium]
MRMILITVVAVATLLCAASAFAFVLDINDGGLTEWGVTPGTDWNPNSGIYSTIEPQGNDFFLNPGYGGHMYDVEAMYAATVGDNLYFAVVTGFPIGTTHDGNRAGDIAFKFGNSTYAYGIETTGDGGRVKGGLYKVTDWGQGYNYWGSWGGHSGWYGGVYAGAPTEILTTDATWTPYTDGGLNLNYYNYQNGNYHYIIEGYVPKIAFGDAWSHNDTFTMHWTETCGNDFGELKGVCTPEPATMSLLGLGLFGILGFRRKKINGAV